MIMLISLVGCSSNLETENTNVENQISTSPEDSITPPEDNKVSDEPEKVEKKTSLFSNDITSNSKSFLPTIDDFEMGWEISSDEPKVLSKYSKENQERLESRGFIEGHKTKFQKGQANLADLENYESIQFSISLYAKEKVKEPLIDHNNDIEKGVGTYTTTEEELNDDYEWEEVEIEVEYTLSKLKNPNIGDESIFWSETEENEFFGEVKEYHLAFVEKNVYVKLTCRSFDTEKSINNCIDNAKLVSKNI